MPVFHFTLHAYRSWNTDNPRGYIQRTKKGVQEPNEHLARARDEMAKFPPVKFDDADALFLVQQSPDVVQRRNGKLYGVTAIETHLHLVVGWTTRVNEDDAQSRLKRGFGFILAQRHSTKGRPYFSRGGLPECVKDKRHLRYLLYEYLPKHNGPLWRVELA